MYYLDSGKCNQLLALIEGHDRIIIHRHQRPDPDAIGSQLGLKNLIKNAYSDKEVLAAGTISQSLSWLGEMDKVSSDHYQDALVIITDTANLDRVDGDHYAKGKTLVKIDHHPPVEAYGDLEIVYPQASSTSEMIAIISRSLGDSLPMTQDAASLLYAGIVGDTGRFMFSSTTSTTFEVTAQLLKEQINAFEINDRFNLMTIDELKFQAYGYDNLSITSAGVAYLVVSQETIKKFGMTEEQTNILVNLPARIQGVQAWVTIVEQDRQPVYYRCRIRSKGPVINEIAALHGGGGHPLASGANAYSIEEIQEIIDQLNQAVVAFKANRS